MKVILLLLFILFSSNKNLFAELKSTKVLDNIRHLFTEACRKRLMADRRIGCLLSGGLDSSLVASLLVKLAKDANLPYKIQV